MPAQVNTPQPTSARPITRRRTETQNKLMDAAFLIAAENGFRDTTVEKICERAGFTRGAFYSNFDSLDELFLALWTRNTTKVIEAFQQLIENNQHVLSPGDRDGLEAYLEYVATNIPIDTQWHRVSLEFIAHSLSNPQLRAEILIRDQEILKIVIPALFSACHRSGYQIKDPDDFGLSLHIIHHGTMLQCLLHPDEPEYKQQRVHAFTQEVLNRLEDITT